MTLADILAVLAVPDPVAGTSGLGLIGAITMGATLYLAGRLYKKFRG